MARTAAEAQFNGRVWTLLFEDDSRDRLRVGGFFAGHDSKEDLKTELRRQFWEQEQREDGEILACHYFVPQTSASSETNPSVVKDVKAGRRRKVSLDVASLDHGQGDQCAQDISSLAVSYATRSAEKKLKLEAAEKRKLARRIASAKKKQKLANDHELYALGSRRAVARSSSNR